MNQNISLGTQQGVLIPSLAAIVGEDNQISTIEFEDGEEFGVTLWPETDANNQTRIISIITSPELTGATFTQLFFANGQGMQHYEVFRDVRTVTGQRIITWKVDWNSYIEEIDA